MLVSGTKKSVRSIINGGGKWVEISIEADPIYQTILIAAEKRSGGRLGPAASRDRHPEDQEPPVSMPNWSRKPSPPGCPRKVYRRKPWRRKSLRLPQPTQVSPNRPWHQRTPSSGQGGAPERSKLRSTQPSHHRSPRCRSSPIIPCRLRRSLKPMLRPPKSKKASLRSASRVGIAIKPISNSWRRSRVWSAAEAPLMPTTCGSRKPARWDAR
jgi:hypothetical protein